MKIEVDVPFPSEIITSLRGAAINLTAADLTIKKILTELGEVTSDDRLVDLEGTPYNPELHSSAKTMTALGRWKRRPGRTVIEGKEKPVGPGAADALDEVSEALMVPVTSAQVAAEIDAAIALHGEDPKVVWDWVSAQGFSRDTVTEDVADLVHARLTDL